MVDRRTDIVIGAKNRATNAFRQASESVQRLTKRMRSFVSLSRDITVIGTGVVRSIQSITGAIGKMTAGAEVQLEAETKLAIALAKVTNNVDSQLKSFRKWSAELQAATGVGDEFSMGVAALIQNMGGASPEVTKRATRAIIDWAQVTGRGASDGARILGRSLQGLQVGWMDLGVAVDLSLSPQEQAIAAIEQLEKHYGSFSKQLEGTALVQLRKLRAGWGDFQETLGLAILKTDVFNNVVGEMQSALDGVDQQMRSSQWAEVLDGILKSIIRGAGAAAIAFLRFAEIVSDALSGVLDALTSLTDTKAFKLLFDDGGADASSGIRSASEAARGFSADMMEAQFAVQDWIDRMTAANEVAAELRRNGGTGIQGNAQQGGPDQVNQMGAASPGDGFGLSIAQISEAAAQLREELGGLSFGFEVLLEAGLRFGEELTWAFAGISDSIANGMGTLLVDLKDQAIDGAEAVRRFSEGIANQSLASLGRTIMKVILTPLDLVLATFAQWLQQLIFGAALEKALIAEASASAIATGAMTSTALAAFWAPAATLAAIATLGAANAAGAAAVAQAQASRLAFMAFAEGGTVTGPTLGLIGEGGDAEHIIPSRPGSFIEELSRPGGMQEFKSGGGVSIGELIVNVNGSSDDPRSLAQAISEEIGAELDLIAGSRFS